jgi:hypothetical protein
VNQKKKRGRPPKKTRGRPMQKGSLIKGGETSVSRELFGNGEHGEDTRDSSERLGAVDLHSMPLVAPGSSRSPVGPSDNFISKNVLSGGKVLGVSFKGEDVVEESRLVALEARDGVANAAMGESKSVP